ncbi:hypothetical protein [Kingella kingae]|uniref:hypothetical protein n=1 Tax=Kingella kingae TaxID=504 RepID=UPI0004099373|nr:hypothetical protein [Kingella kingae]
MIFIWGMAVFAFVFSLTPVFICHIDGDCGYIPRLIWQSVPNNGYCRDLQHEIAAERRRNT